MSSNVITKVLFLDALFLCENKSFFFHANIFKLLTHCSVLKLFIITSFHQLRDLMKKSLNKQLNTDNASWHTHTPAIFILIFISVLTSCRVVRNGAHFQTSKVILSTKCTWGNEIRIFHTQKNNNKKLKGPQCIPQRLSVHYASSSCSKDILN